MFNDVFTAVYQVCHLNNRMLLLTCKNVQSVLVQFLAFREVVTTNLLIRKSITLYYHEKSRVECAYLSTKLKHIYFLNQNSTVVNKLSCFSIADEIIQYVSTNCYEDFFFDYHSSSSWYVILLIL